MPRTSDDGTLPRDTDAALDADDGTPGDCEAVRGARGVTGGRRDAASDTAAGLATRSPRSLKLVLEADWCKPKLRLVLPLVFPLVLPLVLLLRLCGLAIVVVVVIALAL